jgi:hypothetical protein
MVEEVEKDENYGIRRFVDRELGIEWGFYQVLFGIRFRAGWIGNGFTEIDWCCGTSETNMIIALTAFENTLKNKGEDVFLHLLPYSNIKPFHNDPEFMKFIMNAALKEKDPVNPVEVEKVEEGDE